MAWQRSRPRLDRDNRAFWTGGAEGKLHITRCGDCGNYTHPPRELCRHCQSENVAPHAVAGTGIIDTYTINHQAWAKDMEVPFVIAKFIVFDAVSTFLVATFPDAVEQGALSGVALPLVAGAVAGLAAVLISQPADVVFTRALESSSSTLASAIAEVRREPALVAQGLAPRLLFGAALVSLQFLLFSALRDLLDVSTSDFTFFWDALAVLR